MNPFRRARSSIDPERYKRLMEFSALIKVPFKDYSILEMALTHSSFVNEQGGGEEDNQRLEYLGDSVLGLVVNDYLYHKYPDYKEGQLARIKSIVVSEDSLAKAALALNLGIFLRMGRGEKNSGGEQRPSNLADALEAILAAIYLDSGLEQVREFALRILMPFLQVKKSSGPIRDAKSRLQEEIQKQQHIHPIYEVVEETGPQHQKEFVCRVLIDGREVARGSGSSRKRAEQSAAKAALDRMKRGGFFPADGT